MPAGDVKSKFAIFRKGEAIPFEESGIMTSSPVSDNQKTGAANVIEAGIGAGSKHELVFAGGGFSLARIWFKSGYPLPRHSHDTSCLYYITAGSLRIGREELGKGEGFLVGTDVPYTYTPGEDGVELLEFRASDDFGIRLLADNPAFWEKAADMAASKQDRWAEEKRPSEIDG